MNIRSIHPDVLDWLILRRLLPTGLMILLVSSLGACDLLEDKAETSNAEVAAEASREDERKPVAPATKPVPAFTQPEERSGVQWEDRMPADAGRTILVPATGLFPGNAWVDPEVENPYSGNAEAISAGERHFAAYNCAGCHAPFGGGGMGPPLSDGEWIYGGAPAQIYLSIMHGRGNGMPAWASMLPRKATWEIVAYIETLDEIDNYARTAGFDERSPPENQAPDKDGVGTDAPEGE